MSAELHINSFPVATAAPRRISRQAAAQKTLMGATRVWFIVTILGQLIFAFAIAAFYGLTAARGEAWAWNRHMTHGWVARDPGGNAMVATHLASAVIILLAGAVQFIPRIRSRFPAFHRVTGRFYVLSAVTLSGAGLYMHFVRGAVGDATQRWASVGNSVVIWICAYLAVHYAVARRLDVHRRWTIRLFLSVSASYFFRAGLHLSFIVFGGPFGFDPNTLQGPFLTFMAFGTYALPLLLAEIYFYVQRRPGAIGRFAMAATMTVLTIGTAIGTFGATAAQWIPRITQGFDSRTPIARVLSETIEAHGIDAAIAQYRQMKAANSPANNFDEPQLNALGYELLRAHKTADAIRIFRLNTEAYPKAANTWDSLAEAYLNAGDKSLAIANYRKSLQLNPKNRNAEEALRKLNALPGA